MDVVLVFMTIELIALALVRRHGAPLYRPLDVMVNSGAGAALLLALRASLRGSQWQPIAVWLLMALGFHLWDLSLRRAPRPRDPRW